MMVVLSLLLLIGISYAVCPGQRELTLDIQARTVEKVGKEFRRADVMIFIPIKREELSKDGLNMKKEVVVRKGEGGSYLVSITLKNTTGREIEEPLLVQRLNGGGVVGSIRLTRVVSSKPYIVEFDYLPPEGIEDDTLSVKLPTLKPGERLKLSYVVETENFEKPQLRAEGPAKVSREVYILVGKYSLLFGYGSTRTRDVNLRNIREVLEGLRTAGLRPLVKVEGIADGNTKYPDKNRRVAVERARFVAKEVLGESYACYTQEGFAYLR